MSSEEDMEPDDEVLNLLIRSYGVSATATQELVATLHAQTGTDWFYVFWIGGSSARGTPPQRSRTLLAFPTPDSAFAFAQRNNLIAGPSKLRLRRLHLTQLFLAVLRETSIVEILLVHDTDNLRSAGQLPDGITIERATLLQSLHTSEADLTA